MGEDNNVNPLRLLDKAVVSMPLPRIQIGWFTMAPSDGLQWFEVQVLVILWLPILSNLPLSFFLLLFYNHLRHVPYPYVRFIVNNFEQIVDPIIFDSSDMSFKCHYPIYLC
ncbi:PREDICTED: uncharacterized protein LOC109341212 [Lupinus angustifolius]|uniref:uncharacterized protein LOC109341212 n=1 Tax=Lupinus angustifolius TaxID=3871 RepID=UPI00092EE4F6|nr:PREDICTED: uncharacterized protein LOC109341212 [Lupinus angustifolius]